MKPSSNELRQAFLDFFAERDHEVVASSPLVPGNDPTLLFTNAGMVQFKDVFLGGEKRATPRAASSQRCVRAGGKHNDLENVGYTARHHTMFEMLGNFSFGDYFKREAIHYAWEFLTQEMKLPPERLWCTVFEEDDEAAEIWLKDVGVDPERFSRLGAKDNFWAMGDTGPCGPCTEIFYDHGEHVPGGPPGSPEEDGDRFVEVWNLVFMQYDRDSSGELTPLPKPSVDTGMGLERLAAVMQGVHSNYETDLFASLIDAAIDVTGAKDKESKSLNVIADHIRACAFLIVDGVLPGNEGRGYVLRRIIRRAIRHGYKLGVEEPFFHKLVAPLEAQMGAAYPELIKLREHAERVLLQEEERFAETLTQGMRILEDTIAGLSDADVIPGDAVFKLYDTYGFPEDLTADIARERGLSVDHAGFETAMAAQRERARQSSQFNVDMSDLPKIDVATEFLGYDSLTAGAEVTGLFVDGGAVDSIGPGTAAVVVLDRTPYYAESGGQVGDTGEFVGDDARFRVDDTQKAGAAHAHLGELIKGKLAIGDKIEAQVDAGRRAAIVLNHSATHLLHAALREVLGEHVQQKGSLVAPDRLRFDFSHYEAVTADELTELEAIVNEQIRINAAAETKVMPYQDAIASGALAFFGDKYAEDVRVLRLGEFSIELCGGTHVSRAGDIGLLKITAESGIAAGVRRIEAVTGPGALEWLQTNESLLRDVAGLVKGSRDDVADKVRSLIERNRNLERELTMLKGKLATGGGQDLLDSAEEVGGVKVLAARLDGADSKALREAADKLKDRLGTGVVVLGAVEDDKVRLVASVSQDLTKSLKAGDLIRPVAEKVGGRGGGRPDFAQAGGTDPGQLDAALALVRKEVAALIESGA
ncbi:MAG: alanine--tRNA ligase [Gammaproteobacteria bacterium]